MLDAGMKPYIRIVAKELTSDAEGRLEREMIAKIGRLILETGPLTNIADGGGGTPMVDGEVARLWYRKRAADARKSHGGVT